MQMFVYDAVHLEKARSKISIFRDELQYFTSVGYDVGRGMERV